MSDAALALTVQPFRPMSLSLRELYSLLFGVLAVNVPGFIQFDTSNRSHDHGILNPQSICRILLYLLVTLVGCRAWQKQRTALSARRLRGTGYLTALWLFFLIMSMAWPLSQVALSIYRLGEWAVMYCIVIALYSRIAPDEAPAYLSRLFFRLALIPIILVLIVLPLAPDLAFADLDDATGVITGRLGGSMFYPNMLALLANTIVFYSYLLKTGWRRIGGMAFGATVLFFTYSRSGMISLVVCLFLLLLLYGNVWRRVFGIGIVSAGVLGIMAYSGKIVEFLARGHGDDNLSTLSERVQVWMASYEMFRQRPFSGYGYIAGPKEWLGIYVGSAHWMPPHAHNELIQAVLCAGIFGGLALLLLYLLVIRAAFRLDYSRRENVFLAVVLVALLLSSIVAPLLTRESTLEAALFLLLSVHLLNLPRHQEKANASTA